MQNALNALSTWCFARFGFAPSQLEFVILCQVVTVSAAATAMLVIWRRYHSRPQV